MRDRIKRLLGAAVFLLFFGGLFAGLLAANRFFPSLSIGAGLKAGHMCSAVFVARRDPQAVLEEELRNLDPRLEYIPEPTVDRTTRSASVSVPFGLLSRRAVFRDGCGCTLLPPGRSADMLADLPEVTVSQPSGNPAEIPWPDGDGTPSDAALPADVDGAALAAAVEDAFRAPYHTTGVVVVHRNRIVTERYAPGWDAHTQYRTWSTAKSIVNALIGILVRDGRLRVNQSAPIPEWRTLPGDPRAAITIEHLLHMSSGLHNAGAWTPEAYWGGIDTAKAVAQTELEAKPGTHWKYSNYDTLLLVRSMLEVLRDREVYLEFPYESLLYKIGMRDTVLETDPYGNFILSSQVYSTPRDLARFGLLYLHDGVWNGERILPEGWVEYTRTPAPATFTLPPEHDAYGAYGAQFWLFGRDPRVPDDAFSTAGARGQIATIIPSRDLVIVRMGLEPLQNSPWDERAFVAAVAAAFPEPRDTLAPADGAGADPAREETSGTGAP